MITLTTAEEKLAALIWRTAPISSPDLVVLAEREIGWKKSTVYTVLKKLCDKGIFRNHNATITVLISHTDFWENQTGDFINRVSDGKGEDFVASSLKRYVNTPIREIPASDLAKGESFVQQFLYNEQSTNRQSFGAEIMMFLQSEVASHQASIHMKREMVFQLEEEIKEVERRIDGLNSLIDRLSK